MRNDRKTPTGINALVPAAGGTFTHPITIGDNTAVPCTFNVAGINPNEVQVGSGKFTQTSILAGTTEYYYESAIAKDLTGDMVLSAEVVNPNNTVFTVTKVGNGAFQKCSISSIGLAFHKSILAIEEWSYIL